LTEEQNDKNIKEKGAKTCPFSSSRLSRPKFMKLFELKKRVLMDLSKVSDLLLIFFFFFFFVAAKGVDWWLYRWGIFCVGNRRG
jgi:hypothetical protein